MKKLTWLSVIYIRLFGPCQSIGPSFKGKIQDEHESYADIKPLLPSFRTRRSESEESPNIFGRQIHQRKNDDEFPPRRQKIALLRRSFILSHQLLLRLFWFARTSARLSVHSVSLFSSSLLLFALFLPFFSLSLSLSLSLETEILLY